MGLGAGLGTLAAVVAAGVLYALWRRRSAAKDAPAKALSSSADKGAGGGGGAGAQAGKFDMLNPFLKGVKERTLREHGAGRRVGRTAWGPAQPRALEQEQAAQPATPQGAGAAASRGALTVRGAALAGNYADPSPQAPSAQDDEASVGVSVREAEGEGGVLGEDPEQGGAQRGAPPADSPPPFSPPAALSMRSPLGPAPGGATSRLAAAAAASDTKRGVQPVLAGAAASASTGNPLRGAPPGSPFPMHSLPHSRARSAVGYGAAAGASPLPAPPLRGAGGSWATENPLLRR